MVTGSTGGRPVVPVGHFPARIQFAENELPVVPVVPPVVPVGIIPERLKLRDFELAVVPVPHR